jgi:dihydroorotate dehydrogenase (fumarate)
MSTSALLRHGPGYATTLLDGLMDWMVRHGFSSVASLRGKLAAPADVAGSAYQRAGYVTSLRAANQGHGPW